MLHHWDFVPHRVSVAAAAFLDGASHLPVLDVSLLAPHLLQVLALALSTPHLLQLGNHSR